MPINDVTIELEPRREQRSRGCGYRVPSVAGQRVNDAASRGDAIRPARKGRKPRRARRRPWMRHSPRRPRRRRWPDMEAR